MRRPQQPSAPQRAKRQARQESPSADRAATDQRRGRDTRPERDADTAVEVETLAEWARGSAAPRTGREPAGAPEASEADASPTGAPGGDDRAAQRAVGIFDVWRATRARRRTLRAQARRFTARSRRRRTAWIVSLLAVALLAGGSFAAAYSPLFAVEQITVVGTKTLDKKSVQDALADQRGVPLAAVDSSAVKARLVRFPLIETYAIQARPPHELVVRIVERTPVGVLRSDAGFTLVDAAGVVLATTPEQPAGQPVLSIGAGGSKSFTAAGLVIRSLPQDVRAQVTAVSAKTANDVTLTLASGATVIWGSEQRSAYKALVLQRAMAVPQERAASVFDVSSPDAVVVR